MTTTISKRRKAERKVHRAIAVVVHHSRVAAAAYRLQADFKVALTGTPVENRLEELWSQLHFINRGLLGGREDFRRRYGQPIAEGEAEPAARLRERIRPFVLRRLKRDVAPELPPRTEMLLHCELDEREREIYESIRMATRDDVVKLLSGGGSVIAALEALLRLRQAACHPGLLPGHDAPRSSKLDLLLDTLDSIVAEGHKALVFSQWTSYLDLAEPLLAASGIPYLRLDGTTRDRAGAVAKPRRSTRATRRRTSRTACGVRAARSPSRARGDRRGMPRSGRGWRCSPPLEWLARQEP